MKQRQVKKHRGYALLGAIAISAVVLALGTGIVLMAVREHAS